MIKTITLSGAEQKVSGIGGFNAVVHNIGIETVYVSRFPNVSADADNVAMIPAGAAKLISSTNGTVYLLGTGKVEVTGQDYESVNFKLPSSGESGGGGGSTGGVTEAFVNSKVTQGVSEAKAYADTGLNEIREEKADKSEIPTTLPANGGNADTVGGHTVDTDVPQDAKFTDTTYQNAESGLDGLMSGADKSKLDGIETGAQVNTVTGIKGSAENDFRTGGVVISAENVGAAEKVHVHTAAEITSGALGAANGGTGNTSGRVQVGQSTGIAVGNYATCDGQSSAATGEVSHASGANCAAVGARSYARGLATLAQGVNSTAIGVGTLADSANQTVFGMFNKPATSISPFVIGFGTGDNAHSTIPADFDAKGDAKAYSNYCRTSATLKNIFRVAFSGAVYGAGAYNSNGADYAEYIKPWFDGNPENEDRRGYFVTIKDGKLYKAEPDDYIVGITSGNPSVIGNGDEDWLGRWVRDEFGAPIYEEVEVPDFEERIENGKPTLVQVGTHTEKHTIEVPEYDPAQPYIERKDRPEWSCVGMVGVLPLRDDGTCAAGGFAKCGANGTATAADNRESQKTFYVIERVNEHIVKVVLK